MQCSAYQFQESAFAAAVISLNPDAFSAENCQVQRCLFPHNGPAAVLECNILNLYQPLVQVK